MSEAEQASTASSIPTFIITNPDFTDGFQLGCTVYEEYEKRITITDRELEIFLKDCLSIKKYKRARILAKRNGFHPHSHAYDVGFVVGWLSRMLVHMAPSLPVTDFSKAVQPDVR